MRQCDVCGTKMSPYVPRKRVGDHMLCEACFDKPRGGMVSAEGKKMSSLKRVAHDSGDQFRIFHCPMCGSGQVTARSDGGVDCAFCGVSFIVRVQPTYPAFPQTVDGIPIEVPNVPPAQTTNGTPADGVDPLAAQQPLNPEELPDEEEEVEEEELPFKKSYKTTTGSWVGEADYLRHLAIEYGGRSPRVLRRVKASRNAGWDCDNPAHNALQGQECPKCVADALNEKDNNDYDSWRESRQGL